MDLRAQRRSEIIGAWGLGVGWLGGVLLAVLVPGMFDWPEWSGLPLYFANQIFFGWIGMKRADHLTRAQETDSMS